MRMANRFLRNKKGGFTDYTFYWLIFKLPFTVACCLAVILIVSQGYHLKGASRNVDADVFSNSLLYNRYLTMHDDIIDRTYVGNINDEIFYYKLTNDQKSKLDTYLNSIKMVPLRNNMLSYDAALEINTTIVYADRSRTTTAGGAANLIISAVTREMQNRQQILFKTIPFKSDVYYIVGNITIVDFSSNIPISYSLFYNEAKFRERSILTSSKFTEGEGGFKMFRRVYPIMIGKDKRAGFLITEIIIPNAAGSGLFA